MQEAPPEKRRKRVLLAIMGAVAFIFLVQFISRPYDYTREGLGFLPRKKPEKVKVYFTQEGRRMLVGGKVPEESFDIEEFDLDPGSLKYGLGRERFKALMGPKYETVEGTRKWLKAEDKVLGVKVGDEVRVFPLAILQRHEVVNDRIGDVPFFAAYCFLADLGAVYDRRLDDQVLTFAVSGYTYRDKDVFGGFDAFVLWDRDTESLWWPPLGRAVSGSLRGRPLRMLDQALWAQTTWGELREQYPDAHFKILGTEQHHEVPKNWPKLQVDKLSPPPTSQPADAGAIRWGENATM